MRDRAHSPASFLERPGSFFCLPLALLSLLLSVAAVPIALAGQSAPTSAPRTCSGPTCPDNRKGQGAQPLAGVEGAGSPSQPSDTPSRQASRIDTTAEPAADGTVHITSDLSPVLNGRGDTFQFTAEVRDSNGQPIPKARIVWSSSDPDVIYIDEDTGLAVALEQDGAAVITASWFSETPTFAPIKASATALIGELQPGVRTAP